MGTKKVTKQHLIDVFKLSLLGATNADIADFFDITEGQLSSWVKKYNSFAQAMKRGKIRADAKVAHSLYKRACGYEYIEERAFSYMGDVDIVPIKRHMPADVNAAKFWLKNRKRDDWKEQPEMKQTDYHEPWVIEYDED